MCSSVDLPEPDGAIRAIDWPAQAASSAPLRISSVTSPCWYRRSIPCTYKTGVSAAMVRISFVAQRFDRIEPRRPPGRINRRQQGEHERHHDDGRGFADIHLRGQLRQEIQFG